MQGLGKHYGVAVLHVGQIQTEPRLT